VETGDHAVGVEEMLFNQRLYHDTILSALNQAGKPYTALNAVDISGGETFAMVPRRFDDDRSNYDTLPVATAVAVSAAFPILLTPVSFQDYAAGCNGSGAAPLDRRRDPACATRVGNPRGRARYSRTFIHSELRPR
jgi:hypothetical protein